MAVSMYGQLAIQATTPSEDPIKVGSLWVDTSSTPALKICTSVSPYTFATASGAGVAGSDTQVQFNDGGTLAGDAGLTFNKTSNVLTATGGVASGTTSGDVLLKPSGASYQARLGDDSAFAPLVASKMQIGGTTSSFPMLYNSGAQMLIRLADLSDRAGLDCGTLWANGATTINSTLNVSSHTTISSGNELRLLNASDTASVRHKAPASLTTYTLTWPGADAKGYLKSDGAGTLAFQNVKSGVATVNDFVASLTDVASQALTIATGDVIKFEAQGYIFNNTSGNRTYSLAVVIGSTALTVTGSAVIATGAIVPVRIFGTISVLSTVFTLLYAEAVLNPAAATDTPSTAIVRNAWSNNASDFTGSQTVKLQVKSDAAGAGSQLVASYIIQKV